MMKSLISLAAILALAAFAFVATDKGGTADHILISEAFAKPAEGGAIAALTIENRGAPDRLIGVEGATLYSPVDPLGPPVPTGISALALDGAHLRLAEGGPSGDGALIPVTLQFQQAGAITTRLRVSDPAKTGAASEVGLFGLGDICVVGEGEPAPAIALRVQSTATGWQVAIDAEDFTFTDTYDGLFHVPGMGHGHLYVGGMKLGRIFAPIADIGPLPAGEHEVRVTLNTNDHRAYVVDDLPVSAAAIITVDAP